MRDDALEIAVLVGEYNFNHNSEKELQEGLAAVFDKSSLQYEREYRLGSKSIVDFMFPDGLAVEVKIKGTRNALIRQLYRYTDFDEVTAILLITTKATFLTMPDEMGGKPIYGRRINGGF